MYVARFELDSRAFHVAVADLALRPGLPLAPDRWIAMLADIGTCDLALRLRLAGDGVEGRFFVCTGDEPETLVRTLEPLSAAAPTGARFAADRAEFDRLTHALPARQLWLNQRGYTVDGQPVAADIRLLPLLDWLVTILGDAADGLVYQINLRRHRPAADDTRSVRKYLASLRFDPPFPAPLTALQETIASRLLQPGFLTDEIIGVNNDESMARIVEAVGSHFQDTMSEFGFPSPPADVGQFDDLLLSGLHSSRFLDDPGLVSHGAGVLAVGDVHELLGSPPPLAPVARRDSAGDAGARRPVFLSYSSRDVVQAMAVCRYLESRGVACWLAPRNILPGEAYPDAIMRGIAACRVLVVLLSDSANLSPHVQREIDRALKRNAVVIPLRVQEIEPTGAMAYLLSLCQWIDAFAPPVFDVALAHLSERVLSILALDS